MLYIHAETVMQHACAMAGVYVTCNVHFRAALVRTSHELVARNIDMPCPDLI